MFDEDEKIDYKKFYDFMMSVYEKGLDAEWSFEDIFTCAKDFAKENKLMN